MSQKVSPESNRDGSALLRKIERVTEDIQHKMSTARTKIDMQSELKDQTVDAIKSVFDEAHVTLKIKEDELIEAAQKEVGESVKSQEKFLQESNGIIETVEKLQSEIKQALPIKGQIAVNAYHRRIEVLQKHFYQTSDKAFEPVFVPDVKGERIISGLRVGHIKRHAFLEFASDKEKECLSEDLAGLKPELKITELGTFPLRRTGADLKESILSSFVWTHGRIVVTDKSNRKLKIFTDEGQFLFDMLFSNAEPYCVALIDSENEVDKFAITFPKAKHVYFVNLAVADNTKPPWISFYMPTEVGYSGIARGPYPNTVFCTVVSNSGEPRIDVHDFQGKVLKAFNTDPFGRPLFSFPRYILVNANTIIVSDHKMNAVMFLDFNGQLLGKYTGFEGQPLVNPFDITFDAEGNVFVLDGKTGHIHVFDNKFRIISVIKSGQSLLNARLLEYDIETNRLAITHGAGDLSFYPVKSNYTIEEFQFDDSAASTASGSLSPGGISPTDKRCSAGSEGFLLIPEDGHRAPSPGF